MFDIHSFRTEQGFPIVDWVLTILGSFILSAMLLKNKEYTILKFSALTAISFISLIFISILLHVAFDTDTITNHTLGLSKFPIIKK